MMEDRHAGVANAYRTLYLTAGADATVVGSDLSQIDFKATQGAGENRIAILSPGAGRRSSASRRGWPGRQPERGELRDGPADFARHLDPPHPARRRRHVWPSWSGSPRMRNCGPTPATSRSSARTPRTPPTSSSSRPKPSASSSTAGSTRVSVVAAVQGQDVNLLKHSGLVSVQLNPPGSEQSNGNGKSPVEAEAGAG